MALMVVVCMELERYLTRRVPRMPEKNPPDIGEEVG
jgi:hypothetical protein